jgi:hypothetical protein
LRDGRPILAYGVQALRFVVRALALALIARQSALPLSPRRQAFSPRARS